jgi:hypothetical protein
MGIVMDYKELLGKYNVLLGEVARLKKENSRLRVQLGIATSEPPGNTSEDSKIVEKTPCEESITSILHACISNGTSHKIFLFTIDFSNSFLCMYNPVSSSTIRSINQWAVTRYMDKIHLNTSVQKISCINIF